MTYDESGEAKNPEHPTVDDLPKKPRKPIGRKKAAIVVAVVLVVVVAGIVGALYVTSSHHLHLGIVPASEVSSLEGQQVVESPANNSTVYSLYGTQGDFVYFNDSNGSTTMLIGSLEFPNNSSSSPFYNVTSFYVFVYRDAMALPQNNNANISNGTYEGFSFSYTSYYAVGTYMFVAAGYSGSFAFVITEMNLPLSNPGSLVHDEIQAMTS